MSFNPKYGSVEFLRERAQKRVPKFVFEYLEAGCNDERLLERSMSDFDHIILNQEFIRPLIEKPNMKASFCGIEYDLPFGVAPIGMQGLVWPKSSLMLARAAKEYNIPYILSTVAINSIEEVAEASEGTALFQLYNPGSDSIRKDIINRLKAGNYRALIVTADVPSAGYKPCDLRNGICIPPRITLSNIIQTLTHPTWAFNMALTGGLPRFKSLLPYMEGNSLEAMGNFVDGKMVGAVNEENLKQIRDLWDGPLIVKGIVNEIDMERCVAAGVDGVIISTHGARQMDASKTSIGALPVLAKKYGKKLHISCDSGIRTGVDIARALASGAEFTFMGRPFMYGVSALGEQGCGHTIEMFRQQLNQTLAQIGCNDVADLPDFLAK